MASGAGVSDAVVCVLAWDSAVSAKRSAALFSVLSPQPDSAEPAGHRSRHRRRPEGPHDHARQGSGHRVRPIHRDPGDPAWPRAVCLVSPTTEVAIARHRLGVTLFLVAALASFLLSIALWFTDNRDEGVFVGLWVPSILAAGAFWIAAVTRA